ncbi:MAG TPA: MFS transporter [Nevskia sp.]|nr:MFS transporter [Nevskia sp.]
MSTAAATQRPPATPGTGRIVMASLVGTTIEYYDFYIYGTAAALVLGTMFFPAGAAGAQPLAAFASFGIAFLARPLGSFLFGHFGDRVGRKSTLVASMLTMGLSTALIGLLPGYATAGALAPALLCLLRLGQGIGLGGEWGGAALLATEYAPPGRRAWFGMFPQLGPSLGFLLANGLFLGLLLLLDERQFAAWGWRLPFLASALLVAVGLYVRTRLAETPAFSRLAARGERLRVPLAELLRHHGGSLALGALAIVACYAIFYISTVFALDYGVRVAQIPRSRFLQLMCLAAVAMAATTLLSAALAGRYGCRPVLLVGLALTALSGFALAPLLGAGDAVHALLFLLLALGLMGLIFAPMGALLPALFPAAVRYTGASAAYNLGGILGASLAPFAAQLLLGRGGLPWVGFYITAAAAVSFAAVLGLRERYTQ